MSNYKIRAIIKRPDERYGHVTNISASLKNLQKTVDGYIEAVRINSETVMLVNEEGKILDLPKNFHMGTFPFGDIIHGTVVLLGVDGEEFTDCPLDFQVWKALLSKWGNT